MIVKKLYRRIQVKWWNKKLGEYQLTIVTDYLGWFLFGFIPIYLIRLDKRESWKPDDGGEEIELRAGIMTKYEHLIAREKD
jgi:hypothetical protein